MRATHKNRKYQKKWNQKLTKRNRKTLHNANECWLIFLFSQIQSENVFHTIVVFFFSFFHFFFLLCYFHLLRFHLSFFFLLFNFHRIWWHQKDCTMLIFLSFSLGTKNMKITTEKPKKIWKTKISLVTFLFLSSFLLLSLKKHLLYLLTVVSANNQMRKSKWPFFSLDFIFN